MVTDLHKLIAAISPDLYCSPAYLEPGKSDNKKDKTIRDLVKRTVKEELSKVNARIQEKLDEGKKITEADKETDAYLMGAEKAKVVDSDYTDIISTRFAKSVMSKAGLKNPIEKHTISYDVFSQQLEPIYFWILDYIEGEFGKATKLVDNFVSTAASGHFAEMQQRATRMQEEAMKIFGTANTVVRSILNIIYDLKEFKIKLKTYDDFHSEKEEIKQAALLSLKQTWMDSVDVKRGTTSIKGFAQQLEYVTLIDAFMASDSVEKVKDLDLNDRVKRILQQKIPEFQLWLRESESELKKRFELEKNYLKAQVNAVKLYSRWLKPYLKAARDLEQNADKTAALVNSFNTAIFELVVLAEGKPYDPNGDIAQGELPPYFAKIKTRKYTPIILVEFSFRSVPDRTDQRGGFGFRGRADITFTSYSLNDEELSAFKKQLERSDAGEIYKLISGATDDSLGSIQADIDMILEDSEPKKKKEEKMSKDGEDLFSAIFSLFKTKKKMKSKDFLGIAKDSDEEKIMRSQSALDARWGCRKAYDTFKKSLELPAFPPVL